MNDEKTDRKCSRTISICSSSSSLLICFLVGEEILDKKVDHLINHALRERSTKAAIATVMLLRLLRHLCSPLLLTLHSISIRGVLKWQKR